MKNLRILKSILKIGVIAILVFSIHNTVFAASSITISPNDDGTVSSGDNNTITDANTNTNRPTGIELSTNTNNTNNTNNGITNTNLPKTGMEDKTVLIIVLAVCGVSAIYAYKKVSDYRRL